MNTLTPPVFDQIVPARRPRLIWTASAIAARIGCSADFVRTLASQPGSPVKKIAGRYVAHEDDLMAWFRA